MANQRKRKNEKLSTLRKNKAPFKIKEKSLNYKNEFILAHNSLIKIRLLYTTGVRNKKGLYIFGRRKLNKIISTSKVESVIKRYFINRRKHI